MIEYRTILTLTIVLEIISWRTGHDQQILQTFKTFM